MAKPMLATDADESKIRFPVIVQPKIDGVRALNIDGKLTGRSLKPFKNQFTTALYSNPKLAGLDGELAAEAETHPDLCRITTSAVGTICGTPFTLWHLFDLVTDETAGLPYRERFELLQKRVCGLESDIVLASHLRIVGRMFVTNHDDLLAVENEYLSQGYEGIIIRDPEGKHKEGRSTVREGGLLRIKRFADFEFRILEVIEGETNLNEPQTNELGKTFRSSHQENKQANGLIGSLVGEIVASVVIRGRTVIEKGERVTVSAGSMSHDDRANLFTQQAQIVGKIAKAKFFPHGIKDKPRFPTFQGFRDPIDMS